MNPKFASQDYVTTNDRALISTAHYYRQKLWSLDENLKQFGACFTDHGHGHNYEVSLSFATARAKIIDALNSKPALQTAKPLDHIHLNFDCPEFQGDEIVPTTEAIATWLWDRALKKWTGTEIHCLGLRLYEMPDLFVDIGEPIEAQIDSQIPNQRTSLIRMKVPELLQCDFTTSDLLSESKRVEIEETVCNTRGEKLDEVLLELQNKVARKELPVFALRTRRGRYFFFSGLASVLTSDLDSSLVSG